MVSRGSPHSMNIDARVSRWAHNKSPQPLSIAESLSTARASNHHSESGGHSNIKHHQYSHEGRLNGFCSSPGSQNSH